jgi:hypothetical protein
LPSNRDLIASLARSVFPVPCTYPPTPPPCPKEGKKKKKKNENDTHTRIVYHPPTLPTHPSPQLTVPSQRNKYKKAYIRTNNRWNIADEDEEEEEEGRQSSRGIRKRNRIRPLAVFNELQREAPPPSLGHKNTTGQGSSTKNTTKRKKNRTAWQKRKTNTVKPQYNVPLYNVFPRYNVQIFWPFSIGFYIELSLYIVYSETTI